jgi:hypothetical protein
MYHFSRRHTADEEEDVSWEDGDDLDSARNKIVHNTINSQECQVTETKIEFWW